MIFAPLRSLRYCIGAALISFVALPVCAADSITFHSPATGSDVAGQVIEPPGVDKVSPNGLPTIVYLKNLSVPRLGQDSDDAIIGDLLHNGDRVVVLDYAHHAKAISPNLNADVLELRTQISKQQFLADRKVDPAHLFIVAEGFRIKRNVEFYRTGPVGGGSLRVLAMDIIYPAHPLKPVPAILEITCDNANRMGNGSLVFCHDTLLEGAQLTGFATAMIDHPVAPPYKGIDDPMPQAIEMLKAAVRTLRAEGASLGLSGKIGAAGFSRGSEMAAFLAVTSGPAFAALEGDGPYKDASSEISAALIHGARYDLLAIPTDDPMYKRFEKAWGPRESNSEKWAAHGPAHYLGKQAAPMFLNTSDKESKEFREGLALFAKRLDDAGIEHVYQVDADGRGHRVSTDPATLSRIYDFFEKYLK